MLTRLKVGFSPVDTKVSLRNRLYTAGSLFKEAVLNCHSQETYASSPNCSSKPLESTSIQLNPNRKQPSLKRVFVHCLMSNSFYFKKKAEILVKSVPQRDFSLVFSKNQSTQSFDWD